MKIKTHSSNNTKIAEIRSVDIVLRTTEDGLDLLGNLYYQGFDKIIIYKQNITPDFFDLKNGIAGDILQKFSQYRMPLAIVGDFTKIQSQSVKEFIYESNKGKQINFAASLSEALMLYSDSKW
jgi:hypothetical protein